MSKARDLADLGSITTRLDEVGNTDGALSNRNLIINGAMQVAQRGTSFSPSVTQYCLDRFLSSLAGGTSARFTMTQSTDAPSGFGYSLKWDCTTAQASLPTGGAIYDDIRLEGLNLQNLAYGLSSAQDMTLSFWVKSNKTGTYVVWFYMPDGGQHAGATYTISSADTWENKTLTISGNTAQAIANDNTAGLFVRFVYGAGSNYTSGTQVTSWASDNAANRYADQTVNIADSTSNYINITGVQLEVGDTATPFEHRSYGQELALCQRYYHRIQRDGALPTIAVGMRYNGVDCYFAYQLPVRMRTIPTLSYTSLPRVYYVSGSDQASGNFLINTYESDFQHLRIRADTPTRTAGQATWMQMHSEGHHVSFDAEL